MNIQRSHARTQHMHMQTTHTAQTHNTKRALPQGEENQHTNSTMKETSASKTEAHEPRPLSQPQNKEERRRHYKADQSKKVTRVQYKNTNSQNNYIETKVVSILCGSGEILRSCSTLMALMFEGFILDRFCVKKTMWILSKTL